MRGTGRGGRGGGRGNGSSGGDQELRDLAEKVKAAVANGDGKGSWEDALALVADARSSGLRPDGR